MAVGETLGPGAARAAGSSPPGADVAGSGRADDEGGAGPRVEEELVEAPAAAEEVVVEAAVAEALEAAEVVEVAVAPEVGEVGEVVETEIEPEEDSEPAVADLPPTPATDDELERQLNAGRGDGAPAHHEHHETLCTSAGSLTDMLMPKKVKHRKTQRGRLNGAGQQLSFRSPSATSASRPWSLAGGPPARSRRPVSLRDPSREAWRQGVDPGLPRQTGTQKAGRDLHGFGQGQPRAVGGIVVHPGLGCSSSLAGVDETLAQGGHGPRHSEAACFKACFVVRPARTGHAEVAI